MEQNTGKRLRWKPVEPGMIIKCQDERETRMLLTHLDILGYRSFDGCRLTEKKGEIFYKAFSVKEDKRVTATTTLIANTAFSDLCSETDDLPDNPDERIEFPVKSGYSTKEILEWLAISGTYETKACFGDTYSIESIFERFSAKEIIEKITAYENNKDKYMPSGIKQDASDEEGYHCVIYNGFHGKEIVEQFDLWGVSNEEAWKTISEKAKPLCVKLGREVSCMVYPIFWTKMYVQTGETVYIRCKDKDEAQAMVSYLENKGYQWGERCSLSECISDLCRSLPVLKLFVSTKYILFTNSDYCDERLRKMTDASYFLDDTDTAKAD